MTINHPSYSAPNSGRWSVETADGEEVSAGMTAEDAKAMAQRMADERDKSYFAVGPNDSGRTIWLEMEPSEAAE